MATIERPSTSSDARPPPLTQTDAVTSLLSLSLAAANAPINEFSTTLVTDSAHTTDTSTGQIASGMTTLGILTSSVLPAGAATSVGSGKHHRRLGSTGQTRRRLSDAREASSRPILVPSASSNAALSLASLSLSTSPPSGHTRSQSISQSLGHGSVASYSYSPGYQYQGNLAISGSLPNGGAVPISGTSASSMKKDEPKLESVNTTSEVEGERNTKPISIGASGKAKKRGIDYKCESCAKIYRHPNCLNKHRWEHTRQWREASKFVLSKHQQVQLLEAATILSFMGTASTSLPEDRSEWPSFVSGGSLPKVEPAGNLSNSVNTVASAGDEYTTPTASSGLGRSRYAPPEAQVNSANATTRTTTYAIQPHLVSSSVPNVSSGPRMHDYSLRGAGNSVKVTQVRPGLLGVPTASSIDTKGSTPIGYTSPGSSATPLPSGGGGWSLPSSSVRSQSYAPRSRSTSRSRSGSDESIDAAIDIEGMDDTADDVHVHVASANSAPRSSYYGAYVTPPGVSLSPSYSYGPVAGGHAPGYGYGGGYAYPGRRGAGMKREEDEMSVGFSVPEEEEDEAADEDDTVHHKRGEAQQDSKWNGMEMELDMDMD